MDGEGQQHWVRTVAAIWLATLIAIVGMSLVIPFLPLYLGELGVPPASSRLWAGWIGGANFLAAALVAPVWGTLADRIGRKPMAIRALVGLAVAVGLMGYARNVYELFALRLLQGAFGGFVSAAIALAGGSVPRERLGGALGFLQTAVVAGHFVGPLIGGELSHQFGYRQTFRITGAALLLAMLLVLLLVQETRASTGETERRGVRENVRELLAFPELRWILAAVVCSQAGMMLVNPQISLFVRDLEGHRSDLNRLVGLVIAAPALSSVLAAPLWGRAGDRATDRGSEGRGHAGVLAIALAGAALAIAPASLAHAFWHLALVRLFQGAFTAATNPLAHSVAAHSVPKSRTAAAFSLISSAQMLGSCVGPALSGPLATFFGVRPLFPVTAGLLLLASWAAMRAGAPSPARSAAGVLPGE